MLIKKGKHFQSNANKIVAFQIMKLNFLFKLLTWQDITAFRQLKIPITALY